jgi:hypothetical protein
MTDNADLTGEFVPRQRHFGDDVEDGAVCGFCGAEDACPHGPTPEVER